MSTFYTNLANIASTLISSFGRDIQLLKESRTVSDATKPWRGTNDAGDVTVNVKGAIVAFDDSEVDGDLILRTDLAGWIPAVSGQDITEFDFVVDESTRYKIIDVMTLRPGSVTVAYRLQLRA